MKNNLKATKEQIDSDVTWIQVARVVSRVLCVIAKTQDAEWW